MPHCFTLKRNFIRVVCGRCDCCIRFGVMFAKCSRMSYIFLIKRTIIVSFLLGCKGTFHESCRNKAPLPCISRTETPKTNANVKGRRLRLGDYCPDTRPMIPPLIAYCVHFLEKNVVTHDLYSNLGFSYNVFLQIIVLIIYILEAILKLIQLQSYSRLLVRILS